MFDLDGVLAESVWPSRDIGRPIPQGVEMLRHYASKGFSVTIWTARPGRDIEKIWEWVMSLSLPVEKIVCDKPQAALYVDDKAYRPEWC